MNKTGYEYWLYLPAIVAPLAMPATAYAMQYLSVEQAQKILFSSATHYAPVKYTLSPEQKRAVEQASDVRVRNPELSAWRVSAGGQPLGWFVVDEVLGKHEFITYAVAIGTDGAVHGIEILDYRETHGGQIREAAWRAQFAGKTGDAPLRLDNDIANISGATLSCKHIADGVRRLLATYEVALK